MSMKSTCAISSAISFLTPQPCEKLFRRRRGDEFLETRIAAERIEHWIEPERRRSERHVRYQYTCAPWSVSRVFLESGDAGNRASHAYRLPGEDLDRNCTSD